MLAWFGCGGETETGGDGKRGTRREGATISHRSARFCERKRGRKKREGKREERRREAGEVYGLGFRV